MPGDGRRAITDDARAWLRMLGDPEPGATEEAGELITMFIDDGSARIAELHGAAARGELAQVRRLAHDLGGSSATFGAHVVAAICRRLIQLVDAGDHDGVRQAVQPISAAMAAAAIELREEFLTPGGEVTPSSDE
jgi:HPt (histidine-containing phosphotransfer) domain-containing protein